MDTLKSEKFTATLIQKADGAGLVVAHVELAILVFVIRISDGFDKAGTTVVSPWRPRVNAS